MNRDVTFALTSCGRLDLLERTICSFRKHNTYPIARWIMVEDSGNVDVYETLIHRYTEFEVRFNEHRIGPIPSMFRLYDGISTPWIFHCEDDWEFYANEFIEPSFSVLEGDANLLQVWLHDTNPIVRFLPEVYTTAGVPYRLLPPVIDGIWCGYSTNPGLRRTSDQDQIDRSIVHESDVSRQFLKDGRRAAALLSNYVRHIGDGLSAYLGQYPGLTETPGPKMT
jgi:hypothetical protein